MTLFRENTTDQLLTFVAFVSFTNHMYLCISTICVKKLLFHFSPFHDMYVFQRYVSIFIYIYVFHDIFMSFNNVSKREAISLFSISERFHFYVEVLRVISEQD